MSQNTHLLIVEGEVDKKLIQRLCKKLQLQDVDVKPTTPEDLEILGRGNGKEGVYQALEDVIPELFDISKPLKKFAVMVDADQSKDGQGFVQTLAKISQKLSDFDYSLDEYQSKKAQGLIFSHSDLNTAAIGVWIMPNNQDDGAIESWIQQCFDPKKCHLLPHAQQTVLDLPDRQFTGNNLPKAEIATWLAWQKRPSIGLYAAVPLLNDQAQPYKDLVNWLQYLFVVEEA